VTPAVPFAAGVTVAGGVTGIAVNRA